MSRSSISAPCWARISRGGIGDCDEGTVHDYRQQLMALRSPTRLPDDDPQATVVALNNGPSQSAMRFSGLTSLARSHDAEEASTADRHCNHDESREDQRRGEMAERLPVS